MLPRGRARDFFDAGVASFIIAVEIYNRPSDVGRVHGSIMFLQHALEMLLKAAILKAGGRVREKGERLSIGFGKAVNVAESQWNLLHVSQAKELRALEHHRDTATHSVLELDEDLLYYTIHGAVHVAISLVKRAFDEDLGTRLPDRALPVASRTTSDLPTVLTASFERARNLMLKPRASREQARRTIAPLANLEAGIKGESRPGDAELDRLTRRIAEGATVEALFPELARVGFVPPESDSAELFVAVRLGKSGMPVRFAETGEEATIIKQVDCFEQYPFSSVDLGKKLEISAPRARALAWHLRLLESDVYFKNCRGPGQLPSPRYSVRALRQMRDQLETVDLEQVWKEYKAAGRG